MNKRQFIISCPNSKSSINIEDAIYAQLQEGPSKEIKVYISHENALQ